MEEASMKTLHELLDAYREKITKHMECPMNGCEACVPAELAARRAVEEFHKKAVSEAMVNDQSWE